MRWFQIPILIVLPLLFQLAVLAVGAQFVRGDLDYYWGYLLVLVVAPSLLLLTIISVLQKKAWNIKFAKALIINLCVAAAPFMAYLIVILILQFVA